MKNFCIFGLCLVVCVAYSQAATIVLEPQPIAAKRDVRNIIAHLSNIDGLEPAPRPEQLIEDFGGADKARLARSDSDEHYGHHGHGHGGYYGGHGGYYGGYHGGHGYDHGHGHGHGHGHYDNYHHHH